MHQILRVLHGWLFWKGYALIHRINDKTVVLVLSNENQELDKQAVYYLNEFKTRKCADKAIILWTYEETYSWLQHTAGNKDERKMIHISQDKHNLLYDYYCFRKFFDNIVFTYTTKPAENMLGRVLADTDVDVVDAVFLALYHLRRVPDIGE